MLFCEGDLIGKSRVAIRSLHLPPRPGLAPILEQGGAMADKRVILVGCVKLKHERSARAKDLVSVTAVAAPAAVCGGERLAVVDPERKARPRRSREADCPVRSRAWPAVGTGSGVRGASASFASSKIGSDLMAGRRSRFTPAPCTGGRSSRASWSAVPR